MEIKTTRSARESTRPETPAPPERGQYLRRKATQKLRKSQSVARRLAKMMPAAGKTGFILFLIAFGVALYRYARTSEKFVLQTISFEGCKHTDIQALEEEIRRAFPRNLLQIDLQKLRGRVESDAWTKRAEIRRVLPSDLVISVEERIPSNILEINGSLMVCDDEGILLGDYDARQGKLDVPVFKGLMGGGPEGYRLHQQENSERVRLARKMLAELEEGSTVFTRRISEVDLSDSRNLKILLVDDTAEIFLGDRDFLKRFRSLMANTEQYNDLKAQYGEIVSVDLRFAGQIIFRPPKSSGGRSEVAKPVAPDQ